MVFERRGGGFEEGDSAWEAFGDWRFAVVDGWLWRVEEGGDGHD